jgi:hypothetical protein
LVESQDEKSVTALPVAGMMVLTEWGICGMLKKTDDFSSGS